MAKNIILNNEDLTVIADYAKVMELLETSKTNNPSAIPLINASIKKLTELADEFAENPYSQNKSKLSKAIEGITLKIGIANEKLEKTEESAHLENTSLKSITNALEKEINFALGKLLMSKNSKASHTDKFKKVTDEWKRDLKYIADLIKNGNKDDEPKIQKLLDTLFKRIEERLEPEKKSAGVRLFKSDISVISSQLYTTVKQLHEKLQENVLVQRQSKQL